MGQSAIERVPSSAPPYQRGRYPPAAAAAASLLVVPTGRCEYMLLPSKLEVLALPARRYHQSINQDEEGETVKVKRFEEVAGDMNLPRLPPKLQVNGR
ncbi:hypothetical protein CCHR01_19567 [Colletotrichum chrysophilum]|uniref:Uncharacterized protein n=1 Tax=Colletotrichum chrysophilum TaxID=1836956 RepID=A0AAD9E736_9PEZI|nr:hypothetical protein CCHR01_19567 [Colletotrichum chrysophilum]